MKGEKKSSEEITPAGWANLGRAVSLKAGFSTWLVSMGVPVARAIDVASNRSQVVLTLEQVASFYNWYWASMSAIGISLMLLSRRKK